METTTMEFKAEQVTFWRAAIRNAEPEQALAILETKAGLKAGPALKFLAKHDPAKFNALMAKSPRTTASRDLAKSSRFQFINR